MKPGLLFLHGYEKRTGVKPKRVVVHKTSMYQPEEEQGFRDGAKGIVPGCDLVWLRHGRCAKDQKSRGAARSARSKTSPTFSPAASLTTAVDTQPCSNQSEGKARPANFRTGALNLRSVLEALRT
jgi:hypothetical protein